MAFLCELRKEFGDVDVVVSGNIGPRGDGYSPDELLTPEVAERYHRPQIESFVQRVWTESPAHGYAHR